jgi:drug/metabolite transporter (DMT)-like permease
VAPYLRLLGAQVAIGAAAIFARYALTASGPLSAAALRLAIATAALLLLRALRGGSATPWRPGAGASVTLLLAGAALAVHFGTWLASLQYTSVAVSTLLVCTSPLWTAVYAWVVHRRPPSRALVGALVLALCGLILVVTRHDVPAPLPGHALLGDALAACGGAAMAAYLLLVESLGTGASVPAVSAIVVRTYGWAALFLAAGAVVVRQPIPPANDALAWGGIVAMALVSQLVGHTALNAALRAFSPSAVALSTMLEPVAAALLAALLLHEATSPLTAVGGALVLAAVALAAARGTLTAS